MSLNGIPPCWTSVMTFWAVAHTDSLKFFEEISKAYGLPPFSHRILEVDLKSFSYASPILLVILAGLLAFRHK